MITVIDYRAGNLTSVRLAFEAMSLDSRVTNDPEAIRTARRIVFPGVGAAASAMCHLRELGLIAPIREAVDRGVPFLGICLGMQILFDRSEEDGGVRGLGIIEGDVRAFRPLNPRDKVPHMGWNQAHILRPHPLFDGLPDDGEFYFVHRYYTVPARASDALALTDYAGVSFVSAIGRGNLAATQFHPEKSGPLGLALLRRFAEWNGGASC